MRTVFFAIVFCLTWVVGAQAQEQEIQGTISEQFEAFKVDDFDGAFQFATPSLQRMFQSPENFERMVTTGYPMVWRPADVRFLQLETLKGFLFQKVMITDADGVIHVLAYKMEETEAGWRIGGVQVLNQGGANA